MDFSLDEDHLALREAVRRYCDDNYPAHTRGSPESADSVRSSHLGWATLGLLGMTFPVEQGGSGQGPVETMLVAQELGRALTGGTFVSSTVLAGDLLVRLASPEQRQRWLTALASGARQASVALYEAGLRYDWQRMQTSAVATDSGWVLNGTKTLVLQGDTADLLLVAARTSGAVGERSGLSVFAVETSTPGIRVRPHTTLDNRRAARIDFIDVELAHSALLGPQGLASDALDAALDTGIAALCAEAAGALEALLEHTAEHLRTRKQFGSPLSRFQALQHRVADMAITVELVKSMACAAAMAVAAENPQQRRRLVSAAKVLIGQKGREMGLAAIQLHGAMGMTDECRVGHYAKRLMVIGQTFGDATWHLQWAGPST